jgi:hypothetical protein
MDAQLKESIVDCGNQGGVFKIYVHTSEII